MRDQRRRWTSAGAVYQSALLIASDMMLSLDVMHNSRTLLPEVLHAFTNISSARSIEGL